MIPVCMRCGKAFIRDVDDRGPSIRWKHPNCRPIDLVRDRRRIVALARAWQGAETYEPDFDADPEDRATTFAYGVLQLEEESGAAAEAALIELVAVRAALLDDGDRTDAVRRVQAAIDALDLFLSDKVSEDWASVLARGAQ